ncbi:hypothetical protein RHSIM_Rhsim08G0223500 [Rhododendron simsii]|uniref:Plastocyanin-like domain-containing protein n=1 Tax=Rhododendron simsii TaxID=118357 RepID=A0A834GN41_RHOSS|nr:hypothetical protein RHSIM_Rhsim08G0223500 [Rhododendron simsii]
MAEETQEHLSFVLGSLLSLALNNQLFFKIANHTMKVVAVDASYTNPMVTDVIVIAPGQTVDALLTADQPLASYYMAAHPYASAAGVPFDNTTTTGIITYESATSLTPLMPTLPANNDTPTAFKFYSNLTSLVSGPYWAPVPQKIDQHMLVTEGLGLVPCGANQTCEGPLGDIFAASMNNASFELPTKELIMASKELHDNSRCDVLANIISCVTWKRRAYFCEANNHVLDTIIKSPDLSKSTSAVYLSTFVVFFSEPRM